MVTLARPDDPAAWHDVMADLRPLKRSEYDRMVGEGMFDDERLELLWGVLVKKMSPQRAPHASTVSRLTRLLTGLLRERWQVRIQLPLALSDESEPEPDAAVVALGDYDDEHPTSALLIVEVADSSLRIDRRKAELYASAGIIEYWIVNLEERTVEISSAPEGERYTQMRTASASETLRPIALPDVALAVSDILPKPRA
jgi:Uma2 family endonuclease